MRTALLLLALLALLSSPGCLRHDRWLWGAYERWSLVAAPVLDDERQQITGGELVLAAKF